MKKYRFVQMPKIGRGRKSRQTKPVRIGARNTGAGPKQGKLRPCGTRGHPF
jgi:hypothetical protein